SPRAGSTPAAALNRRPAGDRRAGLRAPGPVLRVMRFPLLSSLLGSLEVGEETVDQCRGALIVGQRLADHTRGEIDGERADILAQRHDRALTLGLDLSLSGLGDAVG